MSDETEVADGPSVDVFAGVKVVELAQWVFVPVAGALLADWGADVIHVEPPRTGDSYRALVSQGMPARPGGVNPSMELANRGKRSITLDVKSADGHQLLLRLIEDADVFLTNYLPATLDRLELDVETLRRVNPRLVYARGHGYGIRGPDASCAAFDLSAFWARGGLGEVYTPPCSEFPVGQRGAFGDRISAVQLAFGVAAALFRRERTGVPSVVDTSLLASAMWSLSSDVLAALHGGPSAGLPPGGAARHAPLNPLVNTFRTQDDRFLCLSFNQSDRYWSRFCETLGEPELTGDTRFADAAARAAHSAECVAVLDRIFATRTLDEWRVLFDGKQFPWAPFQRVAELIDDPQVVANGYIGEVPMGNGESLRMPTGAVQFDEMPAAIRRGPEHGQHTELILLELGLDWDEIVRLKDGGVID